MSLISTRTRRERFVRQHRLDASAPTARAAVDAVLALHATDPATVYLSVLARCRDASIADVAAALYDDGSLVRMIAMRRTLFVVPIELAPDVASAACLQVAARLRAGLLRDLRTIPTDPPVEGDLDAWLADVEDGAERALARRGAASATEIAADEPRLRTALLPVSEKVYDVRRNITSRVLTLMGTEGRIVRGQPRGAWTSRLHVWEPASRRWPGGLPERPVERARQVLARRWLAVFGPAPVSDLQWWTGWSAAQTRSALAGIDVVEVDLDGAAGIAAAGEAELPPATPSLASSGSGATLLPALDPTPMGWQQREWFLGPHRDPLFDRFGNIGPTVWWDGRVVGGWAVRSDAELVWRLLEDIGREAESAVAQVAARLHARLEGAVVVPSFRTPLERELSA